jgi:amidase
MAQLWKLPALGRDATSGLPIGVLLTGARFREDLCLDAAQVIEARSGLETPIDPSARP